MYLTYEEYKELGGSLEELDYKELERKARRTIDFYTYNRVRDLEEVPIEVKECVLDLVSYEYELIETGGRAIESETTDTYSIEYAIPTVNNSKVDLATYTKRQIVREHLLHTTLMYKGVNL